MEIFTRRPTEITPYVYLDPKSNTYLISGRSIPVEAEMFYQPIINWLDHLVKEKDVDTVHFCFRIEFFNIASSKRILVILYKLAEMQSNGVNVLVRWLYDENDEDMYEIGQDYSVMMDMLPFKFETFSVSEETIPNAFLKTG